MFFVDFFGENFASVFFRCLGFRRSAHVSSKLILEKQRMTMDLEVSSEDMKVLVDDDIGEFTEELAARQ